MSEQDLICVCMTVTRGEILAAIREGSHTLDELRSTLLCCTGCGTCEPKVRKILEDALAEAAIQSKS